MKVNGFDWDDGNKTKCQAHGLTIEDIQSVFYNAPFVSPNVNHGTAEERFHAIGLTNNKKYTFVVFTFRTDQYGTLIRPISARYMHKKEIEHYEKQIKP